MFIDIVDKLLQYSLYNMLAARDDLSHIHIVRDLHKINLLSHNEVKVISTHSFSRLRMIVMMVSDNVINGDKNDFSKLSTYLKTLPDIKHLVQYLDRKCMLSLIENKNKASKSINCHCPKNVLCESYTILTTGMGRCF